MTDNTIAILYLITGPVLWCIYTAWAARRFGPYSILSPQPGEFIVGLFLSVLLWPLGLGVGLVVWLGGLLYEVLTS